MSDTPDVPEYAPIPSRSPEQLKQFVIDVLAGRIYTDRHFPQSMAQHHDIGMVFMPIALGSLSKWTREQRDTIGCIYEYLDKAGPRSINGQPMFFSYGMLNKEDAAKVWPIIYAKQKELESIEIS